MVVASPFSHRPACDTISSTLPNADTYSHSCAQIPKTIVRISDLLSALLLAVLLDEVSLGFELGKDDVEDTDVDELIVEMEVTNDNREAMQPTDA